MGMGRHDDEGRDGVVGGAEGAEEARARALGRRDLLKKAAAGGAIAVLGGWYLLSDDEKTRRARAAVRRDGRPRLPPGQHLLERLRPMGGEAGDPSPRNFRLKVYGLVDRELELDFRELLALPQTDAPCDVHCVTKWTVLDARLKGVPIRHLAELAGVQKAARHVIFEAAHGYTANVRLEEALSPAARVAHELDGLPLPQTHGGPARAVIPDLYFWKSPKWLTGIRFSATDAPGFWERRGYNNHADPWKEERYA